MFYPFLWGGFDKYHNSTFSGSSLIPEPLRVTFRSKLLATPTKQNQSMKLWLHHPSLLQGVLVGAGGGCWYIVALLVGVGSLWPIALPFATFMGFHVKCIQQSVLLVGVASTLAHRTDICKLQKRGICLRSCANLFYVP